MRLFVIGIFLSALILPAVSSAERGTDLQEFWCRQGTYYQEKIDEIKRELKEAKRRDFRGSEAGRIDSLKKDLSNAEREQSKMESEARRQDILPGWLRCQF